MSSLQVTEFPVALYMNLFDQAAGTELWRLFLTAPEITGSRNAQSVKVRRLGALTSILYGGAGSIDPATDYQRENDITITVNFDETQVVLVGVDEIEHEMTAIGVEGSTNAFVQDASSAVRDAIVTAMLVTAKAGATALANPAAVIASSVLIEAQRQMDSKKLPKTNRVAILDSTRTWDLYDGSSKIGLDKREFSSMVKEGVIPRLFGMDIFDTTLMPVNTNGLFFHKSAVIAKTADELPKVKVVPDNTSIGDLLQIYLRYGKAVADGDRIFTHNTA